MGCKGRSRRRDGRGDADKSQPMARRQSTAQSDNKMTVTTTTTTK